MNLLSISPPQWVRLSGGEGIRKNEEGRMENEEKTSSPSLPLEGGD